MSLKNGKYDGKATLFDYRNRIIASLTYLEGKATGQCMIYNKTGRLNYGGYMVNGYRQGMGVE